MAKKAIIIGAGIAGLASALRLQQAGWTPLVIERAPERRHGGYAVSFSGAGYEAADRMGILPDLIARRIVPDEMIYRRPDGSRKFTVPGETVHAMMGSKTLNLMRGDIEDVLYTAVHDDIEIRFGRELVGIDQDDHSVTAMFADGSTETADLLLGADGLHSATRRLIFGPEEEFRIDLEHVVAVFGLEAPPRAVRPGATESLTEPGKTLAIVNNGKHGSTAFFGYRTNDQDAELALGATRSLEKAYGSMGWVAPEVLQQVRGSQELYFDFVSQIRLPQWHRGRVAVIGDAAWCVTLFAGFGSSLAVAGADALGRALEQHPTIDEAFAAWDAELRPEAERKQRLGRQVKGLYAPTSRAALFLRDLPLRLASYGPISALVRRRLQITS
jgi:2-polyprenyl-6-methoxyphenol hydroxylase-like FAD-dependent oxidoreductase